MFDDSTFLSSIQQWNLTCSYTIAYGEGLNIKGLNILNPYVYGNHTHTSLIV
jgi:hypothetical protein